MKKMMKIVEMQMCYREFMNTKHTLYIRNCKHTLESSKTSSLSKEQSKTRDNSKCCTIQDKGFILTWTSQWFQKL